MLICICSADATATHCLLLQYIQLGFTFLIPAHPGSPGHRPVGRKMVVVVVVVAVAVAVAVVVMVVVMVVVIFLVIVLVVVSCEMRYLNLFSRQHQDVYISSM